MASVDLTVMGAGIAGLSLAYVCARRGARVRVIDPGGVGAGASGGLVGALAPHVPDAWNPKKAFQLDALLMAEGWWAGVAQASGHRTGYGRLGRVQGLDDARAVAQAQARAVSATAIWGAQAVWRVRAAQGDWEPVTPTGLVVEDTLSARVHPRLACAALASAVRALGGDVVTSGGAEGQVVWATGAAGLRDLSQALGREVGRGEKGQALSLALEAGAVAQVYADGLHIVPHVDGTVAIGSTSERAYDAPDTVDAQLDALHARAVAVLPVLARASVVERWAGERPRAATRAPLLGPWPGRPGHFVSNGGFKIGFGLAPKIAEIMADLVLDGRDGVPDAFRLG